jgi:multiple sugar transport system substrate-binding protein
MNIRRTLLVGALLTVALLVLAACTAVAPSAAPAAEGGQAATGEPTTITWAFWGSPEEAASHERAAAAFMAVHPEIKVETMNFPWSDYFTKMQALWASGDSKAIPDVAFLWPTPRYAAEGVLEDLTPYIEKSGYDLNDYWPALLESASYDGKVYGLPRDIETNVLYYNKDLFDAAGLAYPDDTWTWTQWQDALQKLTVPGERYGLGMEGGKFDKFVIQNGGGILDDMVNPSKCMLDDPKSIAGVQFVADLMNSGLAMRDADLSQAGGDAGVFSSDQAAMIVQNSSRVSAFNAAGKNYDVAPVPIPEGGQRANGAGGAAWVMSAASDNKDAAWTFMQWLQSADGGQLDYLKAGEIFPALRSLAESDTFMKTDQPPANKQAFITEAAAGKPTFFGYFPEWDELNGSIISPAMQQIWAGEADPATILPEVCQQVNQFLADKGYPK